MITLSKVKAIAFLKFNQQDGGDRTTFAMHQNLLAVRSKRIVRPRNIQQN
jgi:hypothetical protein